MTAAGRSVAAPAATATTAATATLTRDPRDPVARLGALFDGDVTRLDDTGVHLSGVVVAAGQVSGVPTVAFCTDATVMGGALGRQGCTAVARGIDHAVAHGMPVVGLWHSGGARLGEGIAALEGHGDVFAAMVRASGRVFQLSVILGPAAGGAAYGPALTDVVVMADGAQVFITGPDVVREVTGEDVDRHELGGAGVHGSRSGVAHVVCADEAAALDHARDLVAVVCRPGSVDPARAGGPRALRALLPGSSRRAYDVRPLVRAVLDDDGPWHELQAGWARNMTVGLGRLAGGTVGVVANNPLHKAGCLDSLSAEKAARFVRMCDSLGLPLVVLVDVPGYLPGVDQEWGGVVRRGAKLLHAFSEAVVPRVTVVTRKSFGGAYIAMNSHALGATGVLAWPEAEVAVMGDRVAVQILHRRTLAAASDDERPAVLDRLVAQHRRGVAGLERGVDMGAVDRIVDPALTRRHVADLIAAAPPRRGRHTNIPL